MCENLKKIEKFVVLIDFDECLVVEHASKNFTLALLSSMNRAKFQDVSPSGMEYLLDQYAGIDSNILFNKARQIARSTTIKEGAYELLSTLASCTDILPIIVSSGLDLVIENTLLLMGLKIDVISSSLSFDGRVCSGGGVAISDNCKGLLAQELVNDPRVEKVLSIGHGKGDVHMLRNAHISIAVDPVHPEALEASHFYASSLEEAKKIVLSALIGTTTSQI